ncbi:MAG: HEPN domain-containing protein [Acidobacteria bacterium]|nr:HEPN domain-containing protein [Acidobacteriota bacterium]
MNGHSDPSELVRQWIEKAENDLRNATHTLTLEEDCPFDTVCFHAQQCAEKYLKALLLSAGVDVPRTHDLRALMLLIPAHLPWRLDLERLLGLNRYSVEARYPGEWEPISRDEAEQAVRIAREVRAAVRKLLLLEGR